VISGVLFFSEIIENLNELNEVQPLRLNFIFIL
jgi:hypothetical protein